MTDTLRDAIAALQADDAPTERECGYQDAIDEVLRILDARAALAAAPQPMGCGYPCGYDCNGACFDVAAAPQPAVADREACRAKPAEPDRGSDETPYDRGYVWGYRHGLRDGKAEVAPADETMAWAVVGKDGKMVGINYDRMTAQHLCNPGERIARVAIRVVEGGDQ